MGGMLFEFGAYCIVGEMRIYCIGDVRGLWSNEVEEAFKRFQLLSSYGPKTGNLFVYDPRRQRVGAAAHFVDVGGKVYVTFTVDTFDMNVLALVTTDLVREVDALLVAVKQYVGDRAICLLAHDEDELWQEAYFTHAFVPVGYGAAGLEAWYFKPRPVRLPPNLPSAEVLPLFR